LAETVCPVKNVNYDVILTILNLVLCSLDLEQFVLSKKQLSLQSKPRLLYGGMPLHTLIQTKKEDKLRKKHRLILNSTFKSIAITFSKLRSRRD
jgi:hypothetical protein